MLVGELTVSDQTIFVRQNNDPVGTVVHVDSKVNRRLQKTRIRGMIITQRRMYIKYRSCLWTPVCRFKSWDKAEVHIYVHEHAIKYEKWNQFCVYFRMVAITIEFPYLGD